MNDLGKDDVTFDLAAATVDETSRILRGVTVAKKDVQATGKFVMLDASGFRTLDPEKMKSKLPVFTDEATLETLMGAAQDAGGRVKVRSDHNNSIASRAGFADNFKKIGDRVICDLHLNKSYKDGDIVMETATKTPEMIGCSIDAKPTFIFTKDKAMMRIEELLAVDIVDEGAVTPGGLFMSSSVDKQTKEETQPNKFMASKEQPKPTPTLEECMSQISEMASKFAEFQASLASLTAAPAAAPAALSAEVAELKTSLAAERTARETLAAEQNTFISEQTVKMAALGKERAALGMKSTEAGTLAAGNELEPERIRLAAEAAAAKKPKTFRELVIAKRTENTKLSAFDANREVMTANPEAYQEHLKSRGVIRETI
jgi:hypothetical protein